MSQHKSGCPLQLEKPENEPFYNLAGKARKPCFSSALTGKVGILVLGFVIITSSIRWKMILSCEAGLFQVNPGLEVFHVFCKR